MDTLSETSLRPEEYGTEVPISVGWGDKSTQFHGSIGKLAARQERKEQPSDWLDPAVDGTETLISWRGDGAHFCVSTCDTEPAGRFYRVLRFYKRSGELTGTNEPTPGMGCALAWQPSGALIASVQQSQDSSDNLLRDVIFFERNGLRRYEFGLSDLHGARVRKLVWNGDSQLLAIWLSLPEDQVDRVRIYTRSNYHWYLKHQTERLIGLRDVSWHPEHSLSLLLVHSSTLSELKFASRVIASARPAPNDTGLVASIEGASLLLTSLGTALIPPPMCATKLDARQALVDAAFDPNNDLLTGLDCEGTIYLWQTTAPSALLGAYPSESTAARQVAILSEAGRARILTLGDDGLRCLTVDLGSLQATSRPLDPLQRSIIAAGQKTLAAATPIGECRLFYPKSDEQHPGQLPAGCCEIAISDRSESPPLICALARGGRLYSSNATVALASNCTSFNICDTLLLYTTSASQLHFVELDSMSQLGPPRSVERGARLVTCVPSKMLAVLQMPRGNLESICPRPLVYAQLRKLLSGRHYVAAFSICRKHRIDLNVLCDFDEAAFVASIAVLVERLASIDDVNLLLTSISDIDTAQMLLTCSTSTPPLLGKKNRILTAFLEHLFSLKLKDFATCILTAQVRKDPPAYEDAMFTLGRIKESGSVDDLETAVSYMLFLVSDADRLFDVALGIYDLKMALLIAQHSQKDPKEFLPFLRELQALEIPLRWHRIDDHLQRYDKAITHLIQLDGADVSERIVTYVKRHSLYDAALACYAQQPAALGVLQMRGEWLMACKRPSEAAIDFAWAHARDGRLGALRASLQWQEYFALLLASGGGKAVTRSSILSVAVGFADDLAQQERHSEAARVRLDYAQDVPGAVHELCLSSDWAEADRLAHLYNRGDLLGSLIADAAMESLSEALSAISDISQQVSKQVERLDELQRNRENDRTAVEEPLEDAAERFEVASDDSTAAISQFTRYTGAVSTGADTAFSAQSGYSARSRRKLVIKQLAGKRNTIHEDTYIFSSLAKAATERLAALQNEAGPLLRFCASLESRLDDARYRSRASELQLALTQLEGQIDDGLEHAWSTTRDEAATNVRPERPIRASASWRIVLLDLISM